MTLMTKLMGAAAAVALSAGAALAEPALIFDLGGKFDKSFNEAAFNGAERWKEETGGSYREIELQSEAQREQALRRFAEAGANPIVTMGFAMASPVEAVAADYPDTKFVNIDGFLPNIPANVRMISFQEHEGSYLAGMMAAMKSESGKIGFIGGMDIPLIRHFGCGYAQGAKAVNADVEIIANMTGTTPTAWNDPVKGSELTKAQISQGADVVYAAAGGTGVGVLQTAADENILSIGVDSNQNHLHPGKVLTSMLKRVDVAVYNSMKAGTDLETGVGEVLGLAEDGVGVAFDENNASLVSDEMKAAVDDARAKIIAGELEVVSYYANDSCPALDFYVNDTETVARQETAAPSVAPAIELKGISKAFGPVQANKNISIRVMPGTIHGIIGENGAGKSTLMSILYGFYKADAGEIWINGQHVQIPDSQAAIAAGIGMVFQHFKLVENFTVLENIVLGAEDGWQLTTSLAKARAALIALAEDYGLNVDPDALVQDIGVGMQQRVEILKALYRQADILILDEPTGVLTPAEADQLFRILGRLRSEGKTIILITHKLREIMETTDTVSVMRRGEMTATVKTAETSPPELAELMVGRKVLLRVDKTPAKAGDVVLDIQGLQVVDDKGVERLRGIDLTVRAGEVLGIAGVAGNGQSELLEVLGGYATGTGQVRLNGQPLDLTGATADGQSRRARGIAHVPEDRQREGLIMDYMAWENTAFGYHRDPAYRAGLLMNNAAIRDDTTAKMGRFDVRPPNPRLAAKNFSGGNQQKIVLAREIERNPDLLLIGQPTRGVDIGAIEFIHQQIVALRDQGKAILLVSVELEEILALSDRIAVMFDGRIMGIRAPEETDEKELGLLMAGVTPTDEAHAG